MCSGCGRLADHDDDVLRQRGDGAVADAFFVATTHLAPVAFLVLSAERPLQNLHEGRGSRRPREIEDEGGRFLRRHVTLRTAMTLCDGDSKEVEELLTQRRASHLRTLRFLGENVLLQLVHHVTHREPKKPLRSPRNHTRFATRQRGDSVGVVEDSEGDGIGNVSEKSVEIGRVDDSSLVSMLDSILESLVEHAEEELELAGDANRRRAGVSEDQRA